MYRRFLIPQSHNPYIGTAFFEPPFVRTMGLVQLISIQRFWLYILGNDRRLSCLLFQARQRVFPGLLFLLEAQLIVSKLEFYPCLTFRDMGLG